MVRETHRSATNSFQEIMARADRAFAASATPIARRADGKGRRQRAIAIAGAVLLAAVICLAPISRPQPAPAGWRAPGVEGLDRARVERRAAAAIARWQQEQGRNGGAQDRPGEWPTKASVQPADLHDGFYSGRATLRSDDHVVAFKVKVTDGIGMGTESRPDCGTAPILLEISPSGEVSGMMLIFGSTCRKTELAIRGRAGGGTLRLRLGSQFLELSKAED
jgi:hypothetical protein